jgi:hypothetical protein
LHIPRIFLPLFTRYAVLKCSRNFHAICPNWKRTNGS